MGRHHDLRPTIHDLQPEQRLTVAGLQRMKTEGRKIAAAVVYEYQIAKICERAGVDVLSTQEEQLFDAVPALIETGLHVYPQIGFPTQGLSAGIRGGQEVLEHVMKWAHKIEDAGAAMIDLTNVPPDIQVDNGPEARGGLGYNVGVNSRR